MIGQNNCHSRSKMKVCVCVASNVSDTFEARSTEVNVIIQHKTSLI